MMQVIKRDGKHETISFDKITKRISDLCFGLENVDPLLIAKDTINGIFDGIKTVDLDILSADICATKAHHHPEYNKLGGRILVSNIIKTTLEKYSDVVQQQYDAGIVSEEFYKFVSSNEEEIQQMFDYQRDYLFDYFAIKTLERSYLFKINGKIVERPQHMWMRVAIQVHGLINQENQLSLLKETYDLLSTLYFTHATPTLFNSGTKKPQLSSCYLFSCEDNLEDIFKMISDVAKISKWAGGIGLSLSNIRAKGSVIKGTNGKSEGIIPLCKTLEMVGRYINQGGKRQGSIACYLEPFHPDIYAFIELRKNTGDENLRARDLFIALWVPDLFMKRVQEDGDWTLMCPDECKGLVDSYGEEFEELYTSYEKANKGRKTVKARDLWNHILENQIETGMPYISYKDTVNRKSMQKHLGVIRNSNLCVAPETMILTKKGYYPIQSLENQEVKVWNGFEFSDTTVFKTGENQSLVTVTFSNGSSLDCTPYHKFYIDNGNSFDKIEAQDLREGMKLINYNYPIITESDHTEYKSDDVPILADISFKIKWLGELFDTIGFIDNNGYQVSSPNHDFLEKVKYMLQTLGCNPHTKVNKLSSIYCLEVSNPNISFLYMLGFHTKLFKVSTIQKEDNSKFIYVNSVTNNGRVSDTYCFTESKRGMGIFNGVLTGQCNEIALFSNKDNIAVCFTGDTQILTENGYKCIKDCDNEKVLSYFDNDTSMIHKEQFVTAKLIDNGEKDIYELKCTGTKPIKVTGNHLFAVYNRTKQLYEWKKAIDLSFTDKILLHISNSIQKNFCKLKSFTYIGKEKVYDLNVPNTHNFIAEGFVVHNCNLVSICLPQFVENGVFNFEKLQHVAGVATRNLNNVIDGNYYPTPETRKTNFENRPIGIGIQGQANVFCLLGLAYSSEEARLLSRRIFENIYYGSVQMSIQLAKEKGPYESYKDSPHSKGLLQFDLHDNVNLTLDWTDLKKEMALYGIRNSLLTALMPTASTSQIMSNNECFEPYTSNIYLRKTLAGEFTVVNQHLISDLQKLGLWNEKVYEEILYDNGSVQKVKSIPDHIKQIYKTAFELKITDMLKQAVERGPFIDHMQSMNLFMAKPDFNLLNSSHFYSWKNGLKTGMYYLRTQPAVDAVKFGLDPSSILRIKDDRKQILKDAGVAEGVCPRDAYLRAICESCSS